LDEDGKLKGYEIDLMRELAKRILGNPEAVEFQQVMSSTRIVAISSGNMDILAATMTITPEREEIIDFSVPYYVAGQAVMVPKKSPIQKVQDLINKKILFVTGTTSEGTIKKQVGKAKYKGFTSHIDAFNALKSGKGDAFTTDDIILNGFLTNDCQFRLLEDRLSKEPYGFGFKQDLNNNTTDSFREAVNRALQEMHSDGTLEKLKTKWVGPSYPAGGC
jgi:aspartate/glutamate/glutamine transport system substrate-binding protein